MFSNKSKSALIIAALGAVIIILTIYGVSNAQCWGWGGNHHNGGRGYGGWRYDGVAQNYWLNTDQYDNVRKIRLEYNDRIAPLENRLEDMRNEYQGYISNPDADEGRISSLRAEIRVQEDRIGGLRLEASVKFRKILSADQWSYWGADYDWWDRDWDSHWGASGNMNMNSGHSTMSSWGCCR